MTTLLVPVSTLTISYRQVKLSQRNKHRIINHPPPPPKGDFSFGRKATPHRSERRESTLLLMRLSDRIVICRYFGVCGGKVPKWGQTRTRGDGGECELSSMRANKSRSVGTCKNWWSKERNDMNSCRFSWSIIHSVFRLFQNAQESTRAYER